MKGLFHNRKGQAISIHNAPTVVMIVGFVFLMAATIAYIGLEYEQAFPADLDGTVTNETVNVSSLRSTHYVAQHVQCNFEDFAVTAAYNTSNLNNS